MMCQTSAWREAARTRTSTSSSLTFGLSISRSSRTSGEPYRSWTIALIVPESLTSPGRGSNIGWARRRSGSSLLDQARKNLPTHASHADHDFASSVSLFEVADGAQRRSLRDNRCVTQHSRRLLACAYENADAFAK